MEILSRNFLLAATLTLLIPQLGSGFMPFGPLPRQTNPFHCHAFLQRSHALIPPDLSHKGPQLYVQRPNKISLSLNATTSGSRPAGEGDKVSSELRETRSIFRGAIRRAPLPPRMSEYKRLEELLQALEPVALDLDARNAAIAMNHVARLRKWRGRRGGKDGEGLMGMLAVTGVTLLYVCVYMHAHPPASACSYELNEFLEKGCVAAEGSLWLG